MSFYDELEDFPPDPIFGIDIAFRNDGRKEKYSFVTGYYLNEDLVCPLLDTVAEVEAEIAEERLSRTYLAPTGEPGYLAAMKELVFGKAEHKQIVGAQTVGGTGALYLTGRIASNWTDEIAISDPTWANHWAIYKKSGLQTIPYPYFKNGKFLFDQMLQTLGALPKKTAFLVHTSSHNPTGVDLSKEQWEELLHCTQKNELFPILDMAYQGFAQTSEEDAFAPRLFFKEGLEFALTYTGAKNFSLYSERVGAVFFVAKDSKRAKLVGENIRKEIRPTYSNPPLHGPLIVKRILQSAEKKARWEKELGTMRKRMDSVRNKFCQLLAQKDPQTDWSCARNGKGLFFCSELSLEQMKELREVDGMYVGPMGRVNLTGLNAKNMEQFVDAFLRVRK